MEEDQYRNSIEQLNPQFCPFEKALLSKRATCRHAQVLNLAEREGVSCQFSEARQQCSEILQLVNEKARFALHKKDHEPLTHAQAMKVQLGGVGGLQKILDDENATPEIGQLILKVNMRYPGLFDLPLDDIVRTVVHYQVRSRQR